MPLLLGLLAVLVALGGLTALFYAFAVGVRNARVEPYLSNLTSADALVAAISGTTFAVLLLAGAVLLLAGRPSGRSGLIWLCGTGIALVLLLSYTYHQAMWPVGYDFWIGPPSWIGGAVTALIVLALATAAVLFGHPAIREALTDPANATPEHASAMPGRALGRSQHANAVAEHANTVAERADTANERASGRPQRANVVAEHADTANERASSLPQRKNTVAERANAVVEQADSANERAPGRLQRAVWLLGVGTALSLGALIVALRIDPYLGDRPGALLVFGLFAVLIGAGGIVATVAAGFARGGRIAAAHLARGGGAVLLVGQWLALGLTPESTVISLGRYYNAGGISAPLGIALYALCLLGVLSSLVALTGLADPRTERFIRSAEERRNSQWASWSNPAQVAQ
ncbi:hypothetical protein [Dactylosporangium sp. CS-033363]|uniref:hypothetical protein n=1 Tax=Dactylosporangium sp. CS-033363 TaxID=3239935 RepID=UPI003D916167